MYRPPVRLYLNVFITSTNDVPEIYSIFRQMRLQFEFKLTCACINVQAGYSLPPLFARAKLRKRINDVPINSNKIRNC